MQASHDQFLEREFGKEMLEEFQANVKKMWHYKFDPNSNDLNIPMAELKAGGRNLVAYRRQESVEDFLNRTNIQQSLVKQALDKSAISIAKMRE